MSKELKLITSPNKGFKLGYLLGEKGRKGVHENLVHEPLWKQIQLLAKGALVKDLQKQTVKLFPEIYEELEGLAEGLDLPFETVFAWNCRGDLLVNSPDGCTTLQYPGNPFTIAHNEDGIPSLDKKCFLIDCAGANSFMSFCYPGSIPGHSFACTRSGLAVTINNIRLTGFTPQVPRMVLARAVLNCNDLDEVRQLLTQHQFSGGFHYTIAQFGFDDLLSIEHGGGNCHVTEIKRPTGHANHVSTVICDEQLITKSSSDRLARIDDLLLNKSENPLDILRDKSGDGLPIWRRDADDPDDENTIASVIFKIGSEQLSWEIYSGSSRELLHSGSFAKNR
jgi:hypothetical protein